MAQTVRLRRSSVSGQKPQNTNLQLGEIALNTTDGKAFMAKSGSNGPSVEEFILTNTVNTGSINLIGDVTASHFSGDASGLSNVPFVVTGSDVDGANYDKQFTKLHFDSDTGLNVSESAPGTAFISIGSHFRDIFVSGSEILRATGSDSFEIIPEGGVDITTSITDTNGNGYVKELTISTTNLSSSLNDRIDIITGSIDSLAGEGGIGIYRTLEQTIPATTWSFQHNTGQRYPIFQVFNQDGDVIIPTQIRTLDEYSAEIIFGSAQTGTAIASLGGGNGTTQEFTNSALWTVDHNLGTDYPDVTIWDSNRNIIFPDRIESVDSNQIKVYFSVPLSGHVSVSRGGHLINGSFTSADWDDILNKPTGIVSGSIQVEINGTTGYSTFSSSISTSIGDLSSSIAVTDNDQNGRLDSIEGTTSSLNSYTSSTDLRIDSLETESGSIRSGFNSYTSSTDLRLDSLETESGSVRSDFNSYTSSADGRLDSLETTSSSLLVLSSSIESAFEFTGSNVTIKGDLLVKGTETRVDSTTLDIGDNIISLNGSGATNAGLVVRDATAPNTISGSLLWDSTNDQWIAGALGGEEKIILEGEFNSYTSSTDLRIDSLETESGSIRGDFNSYTSSNDTTNTTQNSRLTSIESATGSYETKGRGIVSGSSQVSFNGIADKPFFIDSQTNILSGSSTSILQIPTSSYSAAIFDYSAYSGSNARAGSLTAVCNGTTIAYNEVSTGDIGDTFNLELSVVLDSGNFSLEALTSNDGWTVKSHARGI